MELELIYISEIMYGNMWCGWWGNHMIKQLFRCGKHWLFGEPLVKIKHGSFFVTTFDPKTQSFKNIDHEGKEIDWTNSKQAAEEICKIL